MDSKIAAEKKAEELVIKYNTEGLIPFPFERILEDFANLSITYSYNLEEDISGVILFDKKEKDFTIVVNKNKPKTRQYFTMAHELGHFFLHQDIIKKAEGLIDADNTLETSSVLYRADFYESTKVEVEANRFAAALIMPEHLVREVWAEFKDIEECAKIFNVSASAMSIRLERLQILTI